VWHACIVHQQCYADYHHVYTMRHAQQKDDAKPGAESQTVQNERFHPEAYQSDYTKGRALWHDHSANVSNALKASYASSAV
jgi:hypothetical protein